MTRQHADAIRELYFKRRMKQKEIGAMFGVGQNTVSRIISGLSWNSP